MSRGYIVRVVVFEPAFHPRLHRGTKEAPTRERETYAIRKTRAAASEQAYLRAGGLLMPGGAIRNTGQDEPALTVYDPRGRVVALVEVSPLTTPELERRRREATRRARETQATLAGLVLLDDLARTMRRARHSPRTPGVDTRTVRDGATT